MLSQQFAFHQKKFIAGIWVCQQQQEELYRIMQIEDRHGTRILQVLLDKHQSSTSNNSQDCSQIEEKLVSLQTQYAKMQMDYFKKIKQLKNSLQEKSRRQTSLIQEMGALRQEFKIHQEEILKVTEELTRQPKPANQPQMAKKNSSPGLLKKSLQNEKKTEKKASPRAHQPASNNGNLLLNNSKTNQRTQKYSPQTKKYSPSTGYSKGLFNYMHKNLNQSPQIKHKPDIMHVIHQRTPHNEPQKQKNNNEKSPGQVKKKAFSPKSNHDLKGFLINSMKNIQKQKIMMPTLPNASPKRILRKSPQQNQSGKVQTKKEGKVLGKLKQTIMEEAF